MPSIALPVSLRGQLLSGTRTFSPASLFSANEPGVWFDPSDTSTLFTDPAGTTPVTTPGNTVGLMLDKSKGLALGAELVENGTFDGGTTTGWASSSLLPSTATVTSDEFVVSAASASGRQVSAITCVVGRSYKVTGSARVSTGTGSALISISDSTEGLSDRAQAVTTNATATSLTLVFRATQTTHYVTLGNSGSGTGNKIFDNISVRELAGNHATQATLTARPTYSIEPVGGRRNLLLQTEGFDTASWTKQTNVTVTANTQTAPNGTLTADTITATTGNEISQVSILILSGTSYAVSLSVRKTTGATVFPMASLICGSATGQVVLNTNSGVASVRAGFPGAANLNVVDQVDYWRLSFSVTSNGTSGGFYFYPAASTDGTSYTGGLSGSQVIWGAQLELGSTATAYQRVTTQHDVTEAGVASVGYLWFDGIGDFMFTSTITPATDKAQVFAGVRKLSDATINMFAEFSSSAVSNPGAFALGNYNPSTGTVSSLYNFISRGSVYPTTAPFASGYAAPTSNILTGLGDISGDTSKLRINGTQVAQDTGDQGTGNFLAYPLFIGSRGNAGPPYTSTSLPFSGHLYSLITRFGPTLDAPTITSTETWVAGKTGFYTPIITGVPTIGVS